MRIISVETYVVEQKLQSPFYFSQWQYDKRRICLVKITTQDGIYGWGEGYGPAEVIEAGIRFLTPIIVNEDPLHLEALWQRMYLRTLDYARRGVLVAAISAIDVALWDIKGKALGQPVSVLLGGQRRDRVQVYATGMYFSEGVDLSSELAAEAESYVRQGYRAVKMKVGLGINEDCLNIKAVRDVIGPDVKLMVDANHAYSRKEALELTSRIEAYDISWFEEPLSPEDYDGYQELRLRTQIPITAGECEYLTHGFRHLLSNKCVDIAQPDICAAGGITEVKRIISLANTFSINTALHCWGTGIAFAAALHMTSNIDVVPGRLRMPEPWLEMDRTENPLRDKLTVPKFYVEDGFVKVPAEPGLGIEVDSQLLMEYQDY